MTNILYRPEHDKLMRFDSASAYHSWLSDLSSDHLDRYNGDDWSGGTAKKNLQKLNSGDLSLIGEAEKIIDQMQEQQIFNIGVPLIQSSVVGFIPNIPAALAGQPKDMFRRDYSDLSSINTPLSIYVEVTVSAGVSHKQLMQRGIALLAFVMAMQTIRPIELYTIQGLGGNKRAFGTTTKVNTKPLDLARACYMLTSPGYARCLGFAGAYAQANGECSGSWFWNSYPTSRDYEPSVRAMLEMEPTDIFMSGAFLDNKLVLNNPIEWVKQMVVKHSNQIE